MVQFIPRGPSFGEQLGQSIGQGTNAAMQMLAAGLKERKKQEQINEILGLGKSPSQKFAQGIGSDPFAKAQALTLAGAPELGRIEMERGKLHEKEAMEERRTERQRAEKVLEKVELSKENILQRKQDMKMAEAAILQNPGDVSSVKSWASKAFNLPFLASASSAQFTAGIKDAYVADVRKLGNRPNMWIEQQLEQATARLGQSDEANLSIIAAGKAKLDIEDAYNEAVDRLESSYIERGEKVPGTIGKEAFKEVKAYAQETYDALAYDLRELFESEQGEQNLSKNALNKVPSGTPLTLTMRDVLFKKIGANPENPTEKQIEDVKTMAERLGYKIPEERIYTGMR